MVQKMIVQIMMVQKMMVRYNAPSAALFPGPHWGIQCARNELSADIVTTAVAVCICLIHISLNLIIIGRLRNIETYDWLGN